MTYDHRATGIHRAALDLEIDAIRNEHLVASDGHHRDGIVDRIRRGTGRALISAGAALVGRDAAALRTRRA